MSEVVDGGVFKLNIVGQIEWIEIPDAGSQLHCIVEFVCGSDWKVLSGIESSLSPSVIAERSSRYVLSLPISILLQSTNPFGWPQLVIGCYNGDKLMGAGRIHIPSKLGTIKDLKMALLRPLPSTILAEIMSKQTGIRDLKLLTDPNALQLLRMESCGMANLSFNISAHGLRTLGYDIG